VYLMADVGNPVSDVIEAGTTRKSNNMLEYI
jgi:hypothetical protein